MTIPTYGERGNKVETKGQKQDFFRCALFGRFNFGIM